MSTDPNGLLIYGVALDGVEGSWEVEEVDENGRLCLEWFRPRDEEDEYADPSDEDGEEDFESAALKRLWDAIPDKPDIESSWKREEYVRQHYGVNFYACGADGFLGTILGAVEHRVEWSQTQVISREELLDNLLDHDRRISRALKVLGITPKQGKPGWVLASLYF